MQKILSLSLVLAAVICNFASAAPIKVGFVLATLKEERYQKDQKYFMEAAKALGLEPIVVSADNNGLTQTAKVENLISQGVKALVIQPVNSNAAAALVTMAHKDKIPVIAYDRLILNAPVDFFVTEDAFQIGALQAEAAVKATGGKGNYLILKGEAGQSVVGDIMQGVYSVLNKHPDIKVVLEKNHEAWSTSLAMATTENILTQYKDKISAILANNSGMAQGAVQAVSAQHLEGKIFIAGADADLSAIKNILAGKQQFEVMSDIKGLAGKAAEVAGQLAKGTAVKSTTTITNGSFKVPGFKVGVLGVDKSNVEERIFKSGFHSKSALNDKK